MTNAITPDPKAAIAAAKREIAEENQKKAVRALKRLYLQLNEAQTVVLNIEREIEDTELRIEQGNL